MRKFLFTLMILAPLPSIYASGYLQVRCNRLEREHQQKLKIIKKIDALQSKSLRLLKNKNFVKKSRILRKYRDLEYNKQKYRRQSKIFHEDFIKKGCPLL